MLGRISVKDTLPDSLLRIVYWYFWPAEKGSRCALAAVMIERFYESETIFIRERGLDAAWDPMRRVTPMTHAALVKAPQDAKTLVPAKWLSSLPHPAFSTNTRCLVFLSLKSKQGLFLIPIFL